VRPCIICGNEKPVPIYAGLVRCPTCSLVYYPHLPDPQELRNMYDSPYFFGEEYSDYVKDKKVLQRSFRLRLRTLERFAGDRRTLLEIGSAFGFFLELASRRFSVFGIDITEAGCRHAREQLRLPVTCADFLSLDVPSDYYDIVCLWDTLEHLAQPDLYVEKISRIIRPAGLICITTGDVESHLARFRRGRWRLIHPPTHLYYFSRPTLQRLLAKYGFEIIYAHHAGFYRSLEQMLYGLLWVNKGERLRNLYSALRAFPLVRIPLYLNLHDILFVIAIRTKER
jgi:SAM-dependent methyltransferase